MFFHRFSLQGRHSRSQGACGVKGTGCHWMSGKTLCFFKGQLSYILPSFKDFTILTLLLSLLRNTARAGFSPLQVLITFPLPPRWAFPPFQQKTYPTPLRDSGIHPPIFSVETQLTNSQQLRENFIHPTASWRLDATAAKGLAVIHPNGFARTPREPTLAQCAQPWATRGGGPMVGGWWGTSRESMGFKGEASQNSYFFWHYFR